MKFLAKIKLSKIQVTEAKRFGDNNKFAFVEFGFLDLINPNFTIRELVIPWLEKGNIPEIYNDSKM